MADQQRSDPFADVISLVAGPIAAVIRSFDQLRKGSDELMRGLENFNSTMGTLDETARRVNSLLNEFEEPVRALLPKVTRTVEAVDAIATRLSGPVDEVVPGLERLAHTLNSPALAALPNDLAQFLDTINDLMRRLAPLGQLADTAGGLFGLRLPGMPGASRTPEATTAAAQSSTKKTATVKPTVKPVVKPTTKRAAAKRSAG